MQSITSYTNVFFDPNSAYSFDQLNEKEYILNILQQLQRRLGSNFNDFVFIIFSANGKGYRPASTDQSFPGKKKVLFYLSDESGRTAEELHEYFHRIFKSYLPYTTNKNICSFPLGHVNNIRFEATEIGRSSSRSTTAFFSGNLNTNRIDFFKQFSTLRIPVFLLRRLIGFSFIKKQVTKKIKKNFIAGSSINFTTGFKHGLSPDEYKKTLLDSKIVFCPKGFISAETFRHMEAMSAGCIVISENLPNTEIYKTSPVIRVKDWKKGIEIATDLLSNNIELDALQQTFLNFWENNYSDHAVATYVIKHLY